MSKFGVAESVSEGHPDKLADQISDSILDYLISIDKYCRAAIETMISGKYIYISGEISNIKLLNKDIIHKLAINLLRNVGYDDISYGYPIDKIQSFIDIKVQSINIQNGINVTDNKYDELEIDDLYAGDQGVLIGYATNETKDYLPIAFVLANKILLKLSTLRKSKVLQYIYPDSKCQVVCSYDINRNYMIHNIVLSTQHIDNFDIKTKKDEIFNLVIIPVLKEYKINDYNFDFYLNPAGAFVIGGAIGDVGLTGRKVIVDSYGATVLHGGGAYSGKDPTKLDRSGAYMARYITKNIVAKKFADKCLIKIIYGIGLLTPLFIEFDCYGTNHIELNKIQEFIDTEFDCRPLNIIRRLNLLNIKYLPTASYGHFGDIIHPWEQIIT